MLMCKIKNLNGKMESLFTEPPKIAPFQFPEELEVGGSTQATCSLVSGDKPIQFSWHKDNLPIPSTLKVCKLLNKL